MISTQSHTVSWINQVRQNSIKTDPILIEKMIMAFTLLENLRILGLDFIFKGGTSLALVLSKLQRFSIDIDVVITHDQDIEAVFRAVADRGIFSHFQEDKREGVVPKTHFKFFYYSVIQGKEDHVLLDILFESNPYPSTQQLEIVSPILSLEGEKITVLCPTIECLLGDKLTAFCPHTTGIQYRKNKDLEIAKQLFDLGALFNAAEDVDLIRATHKTITARELSYRQLTNLSPQDVLMDTFWTACLLGMRGGNGNLEEYQEMIDGITKLRGFIFGSMFSIDDAILCASKIAYLSGLILNSSHTITRFTDSLDLSTWNISDPRFNKINRLKRVNPIAFYYFYLAQELVVGLGS